MARCCLEVISVLFPTDFLATCVIINKLSTLKIIIYVIKLNKITSIVNKIDATTAMKEGFIENVMETKYIWNNILG